MATKKKPPQTPRPETQMTPEERLTQGRDRIDAVLKELGLLIVPTLNVLPIGTDPVSEAMVRAGFSLQVTTP